MKTRSGTTRTAVGTRPTHTRFPPPPVHVPPYLPRLVFGITSHTAGSSLPASDFHGSLLQCTQGHEIEFAGRRGSGWFTAGQKTKNTLSRLDESHEGGRNDGGRHRKYTITALCVT